MAWWIWVLIAFLLLTVEFFSTTAHVGFFAVGAFVVAILVGAGVAMPLWLQLIIFTVTSLVALFFIRPIVMRKLRLNETIVVDTVVGEQAKAMERIPIAGRGKAEMRGSTWNAVNNGAAELEPGQRARVERIDGLTIYIRGE